MRILVVSLFLLTCCHLSLSTEYVQDVISIAAPSKKDKRFIFQKNINFQKLLQGLTGFSAASPNKNIPTPPPVKTTTTPAPVRSTPDASKVTLAIPDDRSTYQSSTITPEKSSDDDNLEFLTQYRDNAYALPDTQQSKSQLSTTGHLPPLPAQYQSTKYQTSLPPPHIYTQSISTQLFSPGQSLTSADFNLPLQDSTKLPIQNLVSVSPQVSTSYSPHTHTQTQLQYTHTQPTYTEVQPTYTQVLSTHPQTQPAYTQTHQYTQAHPTYSQTIPTYQTTFPQSQTTYTQTQQALQPALPQVYHTQQQIHLSYVAPVGTNSLNNQQYDPVQNSNAVSGNIETTYHGSQSSGSHCTCKQDKSEGYQY